MKIEFIQRVAQHSLDRFGTGREAPSEEDTKLRSAMGANQEDGYNENFTARNWVLASAIAEYWFEVHKSD